MHVELLTLLTSYILFTFEASTGIVELSFECVSSYIFNRISIDLLFRQMNVEILEQRSDEI